MQTDGRTYRERDLTKLTVDLINLSNVLKKNRGDDIL